MINQVINGDCFEELLKIESNSVDLILTDPPYNISKSSNFTKNTTNKKYINLSIDFGEWDKEEIDLDRLFSEWMRILKSGGTLILFYDVWKSSDLKELSQKYKFKQPRVCQWVKNNPTPINSRLNYLSNGVEFFFTFVKGKKPTFKSVYDKGIYNFPLCYGKTKTKHPTQKPLDLFKSLIEKHSNEGDLVLDCFGGSGTTGVASKILGRNFILIEKDREYCDISLERLKQIENTNI